MARLGVLLIHGMGSQRPGYSNPFTSEISRRLEAAADEIVWQEIFWADVLAERERGLWACMQEAAEPSGAPIPLDWRRVREFVVHNFGDAIAYQRDWGRTRNAYSDIHEVVSIAIARLYDRLGEPRTPVVAIAHSLGAHILSNYIWDRQAPSGRGGPLTPLPRLVSLITLGCSIPLFALAFRTARPIDLPGPEVREPELRARARWLNFVDRDDVLGWPLRPLYAKDRARLTPEQRDTVERIEDHETDVGSLLTSWNPAAHTSYWTDDDVTSPVAAHLRELLEVV